VSPLEDSMDAGWLPPIRVNLVGTMGYQIIALERKPGGKARPI
jgi:hypothetical protein